MTTERQTWDSIDADATIAQASGEGRHDMTALENWAYLFETGQYTKARTWWFSEIEQTTKETR